MNHCQRLLLVLTVLCLPLFASADLLFQEDFDDGVADGFTPIGPGWEVQGGAYTCETTGFEIYSSSVFGSPAWEDVFVSFDVKSVDATSHMLRFRVNDFEDFYDINLRSQPWNDLVLTRTMNTTREVLAQVPAGWVAGEAWHHLEVFVEGYHIQVLADGNLILDYFDSLQPERLRGGQCAVVCYSGGVIQHQVVYYDNIEVISPVVATEAVSWSGVKSLFD